MSTAQFQPLHFTEYSLEEMKERASAFRKEMQRRHTTRHFSDRPIPREIIVIFGKNHSELPDGRRVKNYYVNESVGIATGFLITALHHAGLVALTHTPSPMGFLNAILNRPSDEKPFLLLVTGFPSEDAQVPIITKKSFTEIATFL